METRELLVLSLLEEQNNVTLTATTSHLSPDGCPVEYEIDWGDESPLDKGTADCGAPFSVMHPYRSEGNYKVAFSVEDRDGVQVSSLSLLISLPVPVAVR
jgi:hypothetical protein